MPKYFFRTTMCTTLTLECGANTLISEIKVILGNEFNINPNEINLKFMPLKKDLNDNDKIGTSYPSIDNSFIMMTFTKNFTLPETIENPMIKIVDPDRFGDKYDLQIEYDSNPKLRVDFNSKEYTIFSDNYQTHAPRKIRFNYVNDGILENMAQYEKKFTHFTSSLPIDYVTNLMVIYKKNDLEGFKKLLQDLIGDISKEVKDYPYPYNDFDSFPDDVIRSFQQKLLENPQIFDKIIESIQDNSPEAVELLTNQKDDVYRQLRIDLP
ncbi:hypothetical protein M9Y10_022140 [Tritrichomonas musculus]|uniref:Ubiquitin-like domain-containing protein n=1 Tax=Tritrichomonas musculus TaxID=1915356 RepID=A0ABR2KS09_9EUKA